ncbi:FecR family protein [Pedobacter psychrodurus]|uniref:FecR family protein n=1 Tax=Pedobacter psychrodurus TaxID=2530456 RepID=UPI00292EF2B3|nr:FecR domain-containing protein [Pedobacter psychrodurus]
MNQQQVTALLDKYKKGRLTLEETALLETWYLRESAAEKPRLTEDEVEMISQRIRLDLPLMIPAAPAQIFRWPRLVAAAAVILIISAGLFYYSFNTAGKDQQFISKYTNDIDPGKLGATLTLANGERILIKDALAGKIASQSGVKIFKDKDGQIIYQVTDTQTASQEFNTLTTARGEHTQVRLPDGSTVFLNAASSLKYPTSFAKAEIRRVSLTGEGYFEIAKDKSHPFIVITKKQEVEVLGTHFNINAYPDEAAIATTLVEGSVKISSGGSQQILKPGFQAVSNGSTIKVAKANIENIIDWKDGDFNLEGLDFRQAMRKIGRWYDLEVIYESGVPDGVETGGWISRDNKLSDVLKLIEKSGFVHFKLEGKKLYVSR